MDTAVVSALYLPPVELLRLWCTHQEILVDIEERWIKQTLRNRTYILGANGVQSLSVPVIHTGGLPVKMKDIRISYSQPWVRVHKGALFSAYNTSPYFEYFRDELFHELDKKPEFLIDLNLNLLQLLLKKGRYTGKTGLLSDQPYEIDYKQFSDNDNFISAVPPAASYPQVFSYKFPFIPHLSAIDCLSNLGRIV